MTRRQPKSTRRIFHVPHGIAYAIENSYWCLVIAHALGFRWLDVDGQVSKDGVPMAAHWNKVRKNGYVLPEWFVKLYGHDPDIDQCLAEHLCKLQTKRVWYRGKWRVTYMRTLHQMCVKAVVVGMGIMYEEKGAAAFKTRATQKRVDNARSEAGLPKSRFIVGTLSSIPGAGERLEAAHEFNTTMVLARGPIPPEWAPFTDYVRGRFVWARKAA